jgi:hypothetical protein
MRRSNRLRLLWAALQVLEYMLEVAIESTLRDELGSDPAFTEDLSSFWTDARREGRSGGLNAPVADLQKLMSSLGSDAVAQLQQLMASLGSDEVADHDPALIEALMRSMIEQ